MKLNFDDDDFKTWREHPITRHVFDVWMSAKCADAQALSASAAWTGNLDPVRHACLREAYDRMQELRALSYDDLTEEDGNDKKDTQNGSVSAR